MKGLYDHVTTMVCEKGERIYPGSWMLDHPLDWDGVLDYWLNYLDYCDRHHIFVGWHDEAKLNVKNNNR